MRLAPSHPEALPGWTANRRHSCRLILQCGQRLWTRLLSSALPGAVVKSEISCSSDPASISSLSEVAFCTTSRLRLSLVTTSTAGSRRSRVRSFPTKRELDPHRSHRPSLAPSEFLLLGQIGTGDRIRAPLITLPYDWDNLAGARLSPTGQAPREPPLYPSRHNSTCAVHHKVATTSYPTPILLIPF